MSDGFPRFTMSEEGPGELGTEQDAILPRVGAFVIDYVITIVGLLVVMLATLVYVTESRFVVFSVGAVALIGYFVVLEAVYGQTIGKRAAGVVVVDKHSGDLPSWKQSIVRNLLRVIDGFFNYAVGLVAMLLNDDRQRVGDMAAGTVVVKRRRRRPSGPRY